ncbi:MAG: aspartate aminotransferase family protein [Candidatus Obscuribacterales bacterium]|nr:aspartate aminotransferase family protein [Candidatus Obscuribacterales bacterium]
MNSFFYRNLKRDYPVISEGRGCWLTDKQGRQYLDGCSGAVVSNLGHAVDEVKQAVVQQMDKVAFAHTSQFVSDVALELAASLTEIAPPNFKHGGRVYFVSGGSEAVETALKMARGFFFEQRETKRTITISRWNSYHGSTRGALSATGHPARRTPYLPLLSEEPHISPVYQYRCRCGATGVCQSSECTLRLADELESAILEAGPENVMAFIAEPVVGAALGAVAPGPEYWPRIREICTKYGVLLIADEVMTGLGRAGANFGCDLWNVQPDIIALGKGLSAGYMPLGAVMASAKIVSGFQNGSGVFEHGFTYSGHPVACAAGLAVMQYMQKHQLVQNVANRESAFFKRLEQLRQFEIVGDVRGRGFLGAVELVQDRATKRPFAPKLRIGQKIAMQAQIDGLLIYPGSGSVDGLNGDHFIVAPPFNISDKELDELLVRLTKSLATVQESVLAASAS